MVINFDELIRTPRELTRLKADFDRPSRLIYSGSDPFDIADFHIGLLEARIRTILGRTLDSTQALRKTTTFIKSIADKTQSGVEVESGELDHLATAINQMAAFLENRAPDFS